MALEDLSIPRLMTAPIEVECTAGEPVSVAHGLGRPITGWLKIYQTAAIDFVIQDATADTRAALTLIPSADGVARLVLLS